jgi:cobalamin biosynthesis Mg chelatase CobN
LKKITTKYPDVIGRPSSQVIDVRKDNEKFMSPTAQLVGSESEIIDITEKIKKLNREIEQQKFAAKVLEDSKTTLIATQTGSESVSRLAKILADSSKKINTDAEREKMLAFTADLSQISARFLTQAQFIAQPSVPSRPERPTPLMYTVFMGLLFAMIAMIYIWRDMLISFIKQNAETA